MTDWFKGFLRSLGFQLFSLLSNAFDRLATEPLRFELLIPGIFNFNKVKPVIAKENKLSENFEQKNGISLERGNVARGVKNLWRHNSFHFVV